jgi:hypothetical protein
VLAVSPVFQIAELIGGFPKSRTFGACGFMQGRWVCMTGSSYLDPTTPTASERDDLTIVLASPPDKFSRKTADSHTSSKIHSSFCQYFLPKSRSGNSFDIASPEQENAPL